MDESVYPTKTVLRTAKHEGEDMGKLFVETLTEDMRLIHKILKTNKPMVMSKADEKHYAVSDYCYACGVYFDSFRRIKHANEMTEVIKCRDHCHITGRYRGAACDVCNLHMKVPMFVPILFHNLEGYDPYLFVRSLGLTEGDISCIPKTDEKYISFSKDVIMETFTDEKGEEKNRCLELRFLDSLKFIRGSLNSLVKTMENDQFGTLTNQFTNLSKKQLKLLKQKGVFPYEYMTDFSKFAVTSLPSKEGFYSQLNGSDISDEDYQHAQEVWKEFGCKTIRDYHDLYLKTDVLLLADVMTEFKRLCMRVYGLEALYYYTSPGLSWDAMLKLTEVELDLISDPTMYLMIEKGIRGGISTIMKRYSVANHKYLDDYDPTEESKYIEYLDANNLYGWAMTQLLPTKGFRWMAKDDLSNWRDTPCILEVDLEYPDELHNLHAHNEYPLAPERLMMNKVEKLVPNPMNKSRYVLNHESLKLYTRLGLRLTKIYSGIMFQESKFLEPYIQLNTDMRTKAKTDFEKDFYKLMNNSVFGKTMENIRKRVNVKLVTNENALNKLAKKPNYKEVNIFHENLIAVHVEKTTVKLNKPIYLGMSILDLSKTLMYKFHYDYIKPKYGKNADLLFTDTDSLCYEIRTEDIIKDISDDVPDWFDTSNYDKDHPSGITTGANKKVVGMMKDECGSKHIKKFVGLRSKLYAYEIVEVGEEKKCKGVKKNVIKNEITLADYENCLFTGKSQLRTMNTIRSRGHNIGTERINKTALSADDDKRVVMSDGIRTLAIGHRATRG